MSSVLAYLLPCTCCRKGNVQHLKKKLCKLQLKNNCSCVIKFICTNSRLLSMETAFSYILRGELVMTTDYKDTLNLPRTSFPMRANLSKREPEYLKFWDEIAVNNKLKEKRKDSPDFILHDGPPYANGSIHIGTALNKILKDIIIKYKVMQGYRSPYVPGWDTHGLPIEHQVSLKLGDKLKDMSKLQIRKECAKYAMKFIDLQRKDFKRMGVTGERDK